MEQDLENLQTKRCRRKREIERSKIFGTKQTDCYQKGKGGGLAILNKFDYLEELNRLMDDVETKIKR